MGPVYWIYIVISREGWFINNSGTLIFNLFWIINIIVKSHNLPVHAKQSQNSVAEVILYGSGSFFMF